MIDERDAREHDVRGPLPRLLIADDDPLALAALAAQLHEHFEIVAAARDAEDAIALAVRHTPDIAILDVQMPTGGGLRATREIHACVPGTAIVALSIDESDATVREMISAGAVAYMRKGARAGDLVATLRRAIRAHAQLGWPLEPPAA